MRKVFADANYWIALLNQNDGLHSKAEEVSKSLSGSQLMTTEMVLAEVLNYFAQRGEYFRSAIVKLILSLKRDRNTKIIPQTHDQFESSFNLYHNRSDKEWSLTDCASISVMNEKSIDEILTYDHHFEQAGFKIL